MSQSNEKEHSTYVLRAVGNVLQALSPSILWLLFVYDRDGDSLTQKELGEAIGRSQSRISQYKKALEDPTPPLIEEMDGHYTVTNTGTKVISLLTEMASEFDVDLYAIDWTDESGRETVATMLTPLHDSRGMTTLFILDSLTKNSNIDNSVGTSTQVWIDDVLHDVSTRLPQGETPTMRKIRRTVRRRFEDAGTVQFDGSYIALTEKGRQQARFFTELSNHIEDWISNEGVMGENELQQDSTETVTHEWHENGDNSTSEQSSASPHIRTLDGHTLIPVYSLPPDDPDDASADEGMDTSLILSETMTIEDILDRVNRLNSEYDIDTTLELNWVIQTDDGLYPWALSSSHAENVSQNDDRGGE